VTGACTDQLESPWQRSLGEEAAAAEAVEAAPASLQIVRLTREETAVRPIPMLKPPGGLAGAEPEALTAAPARPRQGGPFNAFCTDGGPPGQLWVVRPIPQFSTTKTLPAAWPRGARGAHSRARALAR